MILMIDNYDSFTYNLVQYLSEYDREVRTVRNDDLEVPEILDLKPELIVISPGPGRSKDAGVCLDLLRQAPDDQAIFGVCLGFQAMVVAYGGEVVHAPYLMHGKTSQIKHDGKGVFQNLASPLLVTRYHSLIAQSETLPDCFLVTATTDDHLIMGIRHKQKRMEGVQFHPEAYLSEGGHQMIANLLGERCGMKKVE